MQITLLAPCCDLLPHIWCDERVPSEHGAGLGVGEVGSGLAVDSQDEVANPETSIAANGSPVDYAADQHPQTILQGGHSHPFKEDERLLCTMLSTFTYCAVLHFVSYRVYYSWLFMTSVRANIPNMVKSGTQLGPSTCSSSFLSVRGSVTSLETCLHWYMLYILIFTQTGDL